MGRQSKIGKDTPLLPDLQQRFQTESGGVLLIVIGTWGTLTNMVIHIKDRNDLLTISLMSFGNPFIYMTMSWTITPP
jgi:hypothetical protein